jgi:hypothetical protein
MLRLSPATCLPDSELANALKFFTPEIRRQDIEISYTTDPGYHDVDVSWAKVSFQSILGRLPARGRHFVSKSKSRAITSESEAIKFENDCLP